MVSRVKGHLARSCAVLAMLVLSCRQSRGDRPAYDMVAIPSTTLLMGCDPSHDPSCSDDERPQHAVRVARFRIDRHEVTRASYASCVAAHVCAVPAADFDPERHPRWPVAQLTWSQARGFCRWRGGRLPTEAEWELAARGTSGWIYPWGDDPPSCDRAHTHDCGPGLADVGGRPLGASPSGVLDMAGNVDEWVEDAYAHYGDLPNIAPSRERVARGGAYDAWHSRSTARNALQPDYHDALLGFRCASSE